SSAASTSCFLGTHQIIRRCAPGPTRPWVAPLAFARQTVFTSYKIVAAGQVYEGQPSRRPFLPWHPAVRLAVHLRAGQPAHGRGSARPELMTASTPGTRGHLHLDPFPSD